MRASVGARGAAGSTFDLVAREAGVSRGLLHYYFGSKERLLVEVVRRDCDTCRGRAGGRAWRRPPRVGRDRRVAGRRRWSAFVEDEPGTPAVIYEMLSASRHSEEIRAELAELYRTWRAHLADALRGKEAEGVVTLAADAESVASVIFASATASGCSWSPIPDWDVRGALELATRHRAPPARRRVTDVTHRRALTTV